MIPCSLAVLQMLHMIMLHYYSQVQLCTLKTEAVNSYEILVNMLLPYAAVFTATHGSTFLSISNMYIIVLEPSNFCVIYSTIHTSISIHFRLSSEVPLFMKVINSIVGLLHCEGTTF